jgi:thiol-disulfide isomerase/thioredoxin
MIKRISHWLAVLCAAFAVNTLAHADTNENFGFMEWDAEAAQTAIDNGERVIINAWATWCPFCKAQRRSLAGLLQSDPEGYSDVKVFAIDIDDADKPAMVGGNQYGKTTLFFYVGGEEIDAYTGRDPNEIAALLSDVQ